MTESDHLPSSFKDPSGFVFKKNGVIYRQINKVYEANFNILINSGLYKKLTDECLLISHYDTAEVPLQTDQGLKIIKPDIIPFISYPYEWSFDQLKDAALTTLRIQQIALDFGMTLKDASAYNIQFINGNPILIDTLSFEKCISQQPWIAYRQFCEHFLAPLCLMHYSDIRLYQLLKSYIDGIPLDLVSRLLPFKSKFIFSTLAHIHLHAASQKHYSKSTIQGSKKLPIHGLKSLIQNLFNIVTNLKIKKQKTEWDRYYNATNYSSLSEDHKKSTVDYFLNKTSPKMVWDIGSNNGLYSRIASNKGINTISFDIDEIAVNDNYNQAKLKGEKNILPLILNFTNPSPGIGWANIERDNLKQRGPVDMIMALALIHHIAISSNVPIIDIAAYLSGLTNWLIIEFIPKSDTQVQRLLSTRKDIFSEYSVKDFEVAFENYFNIIEFVQLTNSDRIMYLMQRK